MTEKTLFPMNVYLRNEQELAEFVREHSAQPQGEREAFEDAVKQTPAFAQVSHMLARRDFPGARRPGTYVNEAVEFAWGLWQARASLRASPAVPVAQDERELPPLPPKGYGNDGYSDEQMRAYALAAMKGQQQ